MDINSVKFCFGNPETSAEPLIRKNVDRIDFFGKSQAELEKSVDEVVRNLLSQGVTMVQTECLTFCLRERVVKYLNHKIQEEKEREVTNSLSEFYPSLEKSIQKWQGLALSSQKRLKDKVPFVEPEIASFETVLGLLKGYNQRVKKILEKITPTIAPLNNKRLEGYKAQIEALFRTFSSFLPLEQVKFHEEIHDWIEKIHSDILPPLEGKGKSKKSKPIKEVGILIETINRKLKAVLKTNSIAHELTDDGLKNQVIKFLSNARTKELTKYCDENNISTSQIKGNKVIRALIVEYTVIQQNLNSTLITFERLKRRLMRELGGGGASK